MDKPMEQTMKILLVCAEGKLGRAVAK